MPLVVKKELIDGSIATISDNKTRTSSESPNIFKTDRSQISSVLTTADKNAIHEENANKLKTMSSEEILAEKERLLSSMDPALIQFLRSRK